VNDSVISNKNIISESLNLFAQIVTNKNHETPWGLLSEVKRDINRHVAMAIRTKLNLMGFDLGDINGSNSQIAPQVYRTKYIGMGSNKIVQIMEISERIAKLNNKMEDEFEEIKLSKQAKKILQNLKENLNDNQKLYLEIEKEQRFPLILSYVETKDGQPDSDIADVIRNNLARLEHLRWVTFYLVHGWKKKPINMIRKGNSGRQDKLTKQHACITTFEGLINLRKLQAKQIMEDMPSMLYETAEAESDTIWYDYNLMDELIVWLEFELPQKSQTQNNES